jgi:uncharacterized membrane protein YoaK (UPF0700 family)
MMSQTDAPITPPPLAQSVHNQPHLPPVLLIVSLSTGVIDAICLLHLKVFTAYMTGTLILIGIHLGQSKPLDLPPLIALASFGCGAALGGRLTRHGHAGGAISAAFRIHKLAHTLTLVTSLVLGAVLLTGLGDVADPAVHYSAIVLLGLAMGIQIAGSRQAAVLDMTIPAATMILHGLFFDSVIAGGKGDRQGRRFCVIVLLVIGACIGAALSLWHIWAGLLLGALLLATATIASYALARQSSADMT